MKGSHTGLSVNWFFFKTVMKKCIWKYWKITTTHTHTNPKSPSPVKWSASNPANHKTITRNVKTPVVVAVEAMDLMLVSLVAMSVSLMFEYYSNHWKSIQSQARGVDGCHHTFNHLWRWRDVGPHTRNSVRPEMPHTQPHIQLGILGCLAGWLLRLNEHR